MKTKLIIKIVLILAALVALYFVLKRIFGDSFEQAEYQGDAKLKDFSDSPYASVTVQSATLEEITGMIQSAAPDFQNHFNSVMEIMPTASYSDYIQLVAKSGATGAEFMALLDYLKPDFDAWMDKLIDVSFQCAQSVMTALVELEIAGYQTTCIQTTFVDNVTETSEATTTVTNTAKKAFLGCVKKNSSEKVTTERTEVKHCMVPHCTQTAVDPTAFVARLETKKDIIDVGYTPYKQHFTREPDVEAYRILLTQAKAS